jgi:tetratricopeptide (TPR) repeat protein
MARKMIPYVTEQCPGLDTLLSYLKRWEAGKCSISERYRFACAKALDMDEVELFGNPLAATTLRRDFLGFGGSMAVGNFLGMIESELDRINITLSRGTAHEQRIAYLEGVADELGIQIHRAAPTTKLRPALSALTSVRALLAERQPTRHQARLVAVSAKLSTVVGEQLFNAGQLKQAAEWHRTAQYAADDSGVRHIADIALAQRAFVLMYSGEPVEVLRLIAPRLDENPSPSPAVALLLGIKARAHATLGERDSFKRSIDEAGECLGRSEAAQIGPGIFSFRPANLAFCETVGAVALNDLDTALDAAARALALFHEADRADKADSMLVRLSRASALARAGEIPEACLAAKATVLDAASYYTLCVRTYARAFSEDISAVKSPDAAQWRDVLTEVERASTTESAIQGT